MKAKKQRKSTRGLKAPKKLEAQKTLSKGKSAQYLQYNLSDTMVTGY